VDRYEETLAAASDTTNRSVTLDTYCHLIKGAEAGAAKAIEGVLK
jgi:hypothetical protein